MFSEVDIPEALLDTSSNEEQRRAGVKAFHEQLDKDLCILTRVFMRVYGRNEPVATRHKEVNKEVRLLDENYPLSRFDYESQGKTKSLLMKPETSSRRDMEMVLRIPSFFAEWKGDVVTAVAPFLKLMLPQRFGNLSVTDAMRMVAGGYGLVGDIKQCSLTNQYGCIQSLKAALSGDDGDVFTYVTDGDCIEQHENYEETAVTDPNTRYFDICQGTNISPRVRGIFRIPYTHLDFLFPTESNEDLSNTYSWFDRIEKTASSFHLDIELYRACSESRERYLTSTMGQLVSGLTSRAQIDSGPLNLNDGGHDQTDDLFCGVRTLVEDEDHEKSLELAMERAREEARREIEESRREPRPSMKRRETMR